MKRLTESLATGLYLGKMPFMPGTFGTLLGIPIAWSLMKGGTLFYMVMTIALIIIAAVIAEMHERYTAAHDPGEIVIDEVVGYVVTMTWLPATWQAFLGAFILFRFFDILKPFPISYLDRNIEGGLGTVIDDVAAGLVANVLLQIVYSHSAWLGETLHV